MRTLAALAAALSAGCAGTLELTDLDRLERSLEARTVALEQGYTLWSPFAAAQTQDWVGMVDEELTAGCALFGVQPGERLMLVLVPIERLGPQMSVEGGAVHVEAPPQHPLHGVAGQAGPGTVVIYVTPDRKLEGDSGPLLAHRAASDYRRTLRHELAHVLARAAGLEGARWFREGVAHLVETYQLEQGRLVDRGPDDVVLLVAHTFPSEQWGLARLLDWSEDGARVAAGEEAVDEVSRTLCGLFVRFLAERQPPGTLDQRLRAVQAMSRSELLALDPLWHTWLAERIAGIGGGLLRGSDGGAGNRAESH